MADTLSTVTLNECPGLSLASAKYLLQVMIADRPRYQGQLSATQGEFNAFVLGLRAGERVYREKHGAELFRGLTLKGCRQVQINPPGQKVSP